MKNTDQTSESPWFKTTVIPELTKCPYGVMENKNIFVLIDGKTPALGCCIQIFPSEAPEFRANGYGGNWNITHWMYIPTLPTN